MWIRTIGSQKCLITGIYLCLTCIPRYKILYSWAASINKGEILSPFGFAGTIARPVFLCLQMIQTDLDFPTRENGKTIILFFFSFVLDCLFVVLVPLSRLKYLERHFEQRALSFSICASAFCAPSHWSCSTLIFLVWPFSFQHLQSSHLAFVNGIIHALIPIQHTWSYWVKTNCRSIPHVFGDSFMEWFTCKQT